MALITALTGEKKEGDNKRVCNLLKNRGDGRKKKTELHKKGATGNKSG